MPAPINPLNPQGIYTNNPMGVGNGYQLPQYAQPQYQQMVNPYQQMPPVQQMVQRQFIQMIPVSNAKEIENYPTVEKTFFYCAADDAVYAKDMNGLEKYTKNDVNQNGQKVEYVTKAEFEELKKLIDDLTK